VGINGFGRIGRLALRAAWGWPEFEFVHVNEIGGDAAEVRRPTTIDAVNSLLQAAADGPLAGILGYETRPLVSVDFRDDPRSAVVDAPSTMVTNSTQVKILAWYDNEWGYANRYVELARLVAQRWEEAAR
jgi:glyceraldehyde-3-phosphate dehydrogenase/erythrose-4-phosphate dehydrogenase